MEKTHVVPEELRNEYFFQNGVFEWKDHNHLNVGDLFIHELAFYSGKETFKPWVNKEESIIDLLKEWELIQDSLKNIFDRRDRNGAVVVMRKGIGLFIQFLFWSNGKPCNLSKEYPLGDLKVKPVNLSERLAFILLRPNLYHSYIQLNELMLEQEKQYQKARVLKSI